MTAYNYTTYDSNLVVNALKDTKSSVVALVDVQ